ncbi:MAG: hypothetical protein QXJ56_03755 [Ignisphaera sp.]
MSIATIHAIAKYGEETSIYGDRIIGTVQGIELYVRKSMTVAEKAMELEYEIRELIERFGKYMEVLIGKNLYRTYTMSIESLRCREGYGYQNARGGYRESCCRGYNKSCNLHTTRC